MQEFFPTSVVKYPNGSNVCTRPPTTFFSGSQESWWGSRRNTDTQKHKIKLREIQFLGIFLHGPSVTVELYSL